jgi:hypothetical protein
MWNSVATGPVGEMIGEVSLTGSSVASAFAHVHLAAMVTLLPVPVVPTEASMVSRTAKLVIGAATLPSAPMALSRSIVATASGGGGGGAGAAAGASASLA